MESETNKMAIILESAKAIHVWGEIVKKTPHYQKLMKPVHLWKYIQLHHVNQGYDVPW